jgi:hypothetical protein
MHYLGSEDIQTLVSQKIALEKIWLNQNLFFIDRAQLELRH